MGVIGADDIAKAFGELDMKTRKRFMKAALNKAGANIAQEASGNVMSISPTIAKSVGVSMKSYRAGRFHVMKIGPTNDPAHWKTKKRWSPVAGEYIEVTHKPVFTAHLVEGGTKAHDIVIRKGRKKPLRMKHPGTKAQPWLGPAKEQGWNRAEQIYLTTMWTFLQAEAKRQAKRALASSPEGLAKKAARAAKRAAKIDAKAAQLIAAGAPE